MKLHETEVLSRERFGDHVLLRYRWTGEPPEPGQFVMARANGVAASSGRDLDPFLSRPFFVHDYDGDIASLLFEVRGRGTALLAGKDAGERLAVSAPLGQGFTLGEDLKSGPVVLVGGGGWVAPLGLLCRRLRISGIEHRVYLEIPSMAPEAYAARILKIYPDAIPVPTDGTADASWTVLDSLGDLGLYSALYASGPARMLAAAKAASAGMVPTQLALRERMACANGSCYGCAVLVWENGERSYARACIEGPVFPAEVLAW